MNRLFLLLFGAVSLVAHAQVPDYVPTEGWWRGILSMGMPMMKVGMGMMVVNGAHQFRSICH